MSTERRTLHGKRLLVASIGLATASLTGCVPFTSGNLIAPPPEDAGPDAGRDAGTDAGVQPVDAGTLADDAPADAGVPADDAPSDADTTDGG